MSCEELLAAPIIEARGLGKSYDVYDKPEHRLWQLIFGRWKRFYRKFPALSGVDLDLMRGETVGVVGRNGSGKSTLLQIVSGILQPSEGELVVRGHVAPILALGVGFDPEFTGRENVKTSATLMGISRESFEERLEGLIAFADIGEFFDRPVRCYSSGMVARLAFAVAIHAEPEILVIDEILAVGDEAFARKCFARIEQLKEAGSTILFVSHASNLVVQLCDRAILMEGGERVLTGVPREVVSAYHKLLYSAVERRAEVLDEIRALDEGRGPRESTDGAEDAAEPDAPSVPSPGRGRFDPELRAQSTVEYPSLGARIENPRILDSTDQVINVLEAGGAYTYTYDVVFDETALGVRFGMMVKLVTGFELGGQASHPWGQGLDVVDSGSKVVVRFRFRAILAPGAYFMNAGVLGLSDQGEEYLHRILDALMFRVEGETSLLTTGQVDLSLSPGAKLAIEARSESAG